MGLLSDILERLVRGNDARPAKQEVQTDISLLKVKDEENRRRIEKLEQELPVLRALVWDKFKFFATVIFGTIAIVFTVAGWISYRLNQDIANEIRGKVDREITVMTNKIALLVGDAFKRPLLFALRPDGTSIGGTTNALQNDGGTYHLNWLFLTNASEKRTDPLFIRISLSGANLWSKDWEWGPSPNTNFQFSYTSKRTDLTVAPGQFLSIHDFEFNSTGLQPITECQLEVIYGGERELRTRFYIKPE